MRPTSVTVDAKRDRAGASAAAVFALLHPWLRAGVLFAWLLAAMPGAAASESLQLDALPTGSLGAHLQLLSETSGVLTLPQAQALLREGKFRPARESIPNFGIGAPPVWLHLDLVNPTDRPQDLRLLAGTTWVDRLDVYVVQAGTLAAHWLTGDEQPEQVGLVPAIGYTFELRILPGHSELYLRAESIDPMVLPIELLPEAAFEQRQRILGYVYGFLYGFLAAALAYNLLLFARLSEGSYLYYALYLAGIIVGNVAYTGHGLAWLWPGQLGLQRYVILVQMVVLSSFGLLFARRFLDLPRHAPRAARAIAWFVATGVGALSLCVLLRSHLGADLVGFCFMTAFAVIMVALGVWAARHRGRAGRYFLAAALCGMLGEVVTVLSVWGWLPFTPTTYHALEAGVIAEATLLALALANQLQSYQQARVDAERLARLDPLTGLHNRRAFMELAIPGWSTAMRGSRPLSLIMIDLDHFKQLNDEHGHEAGDRALVEVARMLSRETRAGDMLARWGGEEIIVMLPETDLAHACAFAERMRQAIAAIRLPVKQGFMSLTASFGVVERDNHGDLAELIRAADKQLYEAKRLGRNRVSFATAARTSDAEPA